jgi:protein-tyrosine-phosphatase
MNELTPDEHGMLVDAIHDSATVIHKGQRMNERIIELMLEAGKTIPGDKHIDTDFCKKFAELIVKECAKVCDELQKWPSTEPRHCANDIRIHFGVEE